MDERLKLAVSAYSLARLFYRLRLQLIVCLTQYKTSLQLCVEPPAMVLLAFAAECWRPQHGARSYRSISAAYTGAQQQTRRPPLLLSIDGTDRRADRRTLGCYIDPAPPTVRAVSVITGTAWAIWPALPIIHLLNKCKKT